MFGYIWHSFLISMPYNVQSNRAMFKIRGGGAKGVLNNVKKTAAFLKKIFPYHGKDARVFLSKGHFSLLLFLPTYTKNGWYQVSLSLSLSMPSLSLSRCFEKATFLCCFFFCLFRHWAPDIFSVSSDLQTMSAWH